MVVWYMRFDDVFYNVMFSFYRDWIDLYHMHYVSQRR